MSSKKKEKKEKTPIYHVTLADIENYRRQGYEQGRKDSIEKATEFSMAVPIMVLRDEFGFGQQRIIKFAAAFKELYESIDEKYLDLQDILKTIKEETGVEIVSRN